MNKKILCAALLGGLSLANTAMAQEFDDRWYLTGSAGWNQQDSDRRTEDTQFLTLGLGKFISPNWSLDGELNYQNPNFSSNKDLNWSQYGISLDLRRHFIQRRSAIGRVRQQINPIPQRRAAQRLDGAPDAHAAGRCLGGQADE